MSGEGYKPKVESKESLEIQNPYIEAFMVSFDKEFGAIPERENVREILGAFFEEEIKNIELYHSKETGAAFPVTHVSLRELAHRLYGKEMSPSDQPAEPDTRNIKREFIFGSPNIMENGGAFEFVEFAIHEVMKKIPVALEDLKEGREPEDYAVTTLGYPTNTAGVMTPELLEEMKGKPFEALGSVAAEYVQEKIERLPQDRLKVSFTGMSIGASTAVRAAEALLERKRKDGTDVVSQEPCDAVPALSVRTESAVGLGPSKVRVVQTPFGVWGDLYLERKNNEYVRQVGPGLARFRADIAHIQTEMGIPPEMSGEQTLMKVRALLSTWLALGKSALPKEGTKVTEVYGRNDLSTITPSIWTASSAFKDKEESLGKNILPNKNPKKRTFVLNMMHLQPFDRPNEMGRFKRAAEALQKAREA